MHFFPGRTLVSIDGANLHGASKAIGLDIDFAKMLTFLNAGTDVLRVSYYTAIDENPVSGPGIRPLCDYLAYNGYNLVTKPAKSYATNDGARRLKGNMDIEIAVDALESVRHYDNLVLMSGDGDFVPLVRALQRAGKRVIVVSASGVQTLSDDLRRAADRFIDLSSEPVKKLIARAPREMLAA